ncbi:Hsp20/alpha crystallin family protein [Fulvivirga sediminis]|uniref:Hsp20/alpha crystallin family protein n=1 Tax=Fulvivirga sediminis TaxID=2803949 RepID=A0A937F7J9_9BACT|nr:Hsp20/alpha crystallin family protein [Fulvivirga sediminis]MBL3655443.1 Hsp20/alpha crystallin family protein [Fulvivirga sediminis]
MLYDIQNYNKRNEMNPGFWDQFTNRDVFEDFPFERGPSRLPAVNVIENKQEFIIELASPGMCKDNYKLEVQNNILNISGDVRSGVDSTKENYTRREFKHSSFTKSFMLPDFVEQEAIAASCSDGILTVHMPKRQEAEIESKREIFID